MTRTSPCEVDRLTRSLADFAKLVELFDEYAVSFVSVTQSFNTTSSMGRLTLNVLLSFAQFEREVIGERVRDKIAASKRKGIWVGGPVPLGYRSAGKKLEVVAGGGGAGRKIYDDYLRLGSIGELAAALEAGGVRPKPRLLANGTTIAASRFMIGPLAHILKNRFYIGEVAYRGEIHKGEHAPILDRQLFDAVQARTRRARRAAEHATLAVAFLADGIDLRRSRQSDEPEPRQQEGRALPLLCLAGILQSRKSEAGSVSRASGPDIENIVVAALRRAIADRNVAADDHDGDRRADVSERDRTITKTTNSTVAATSLDTDRDLIARHVARIVLRPRVIEIAMSDKRDDRGDASRAATGGKRRSPDDADQRAARSDCGATDTKTLCSPCRDFLLFSWKGRKVNGLRRLKEFSAPFGERADAVSRPVLAPGL